MHARTSVSRLFVAMLFLAWIIPGLIGRDLWKADEPYSFGLVDHIVQTGEWTVPTLAGEPFMEKPPLFYITAAGFVRLGTPWLKPHEAARLANFFFMLLTVVFIGMTARELQGKEYGWIAATLLIGSTGLQITAHKLITDVGLLAGFSIALFGLALSPRRFALGGLWTGIGSGIGFLSKGLLAPGIIGIIALTLPVLSQWRRKEYVSTLLIALLAALPLLVVWPYALYRKSPFLFTEWFWYQNLGRFLGFAHVGRKFSSASYLTILPWFALPAFPLALRTLWKKACSGPARSPAVLFPLTAFLVMFLVLSFSSSIRDIYALPMLLPLTLLATAGIDSLTKRAQRSFNAFNILFFGLVALALWTGWIIMITGFPASWATKLRALQPGYTPSLNIILLAAAYAYTIAWIFTTVRSKRLTSHPAFTWATGMTLVWALLMTIWLPWLDAGSSYRAVFSSLRKAIPAQNCRVASIGIGESERAMLEYYTGLITDRVEVRNMVDADFFLVEGSHKENLPAGMKWRLVWKQQRPGINPKETYRLYQRIEETAEKKDVRYSSLKFLQEDKESDYYR